MTDRDHPSAPPTGSASPPLSGKAGRKTNRLGFAALILICVGVFSVVNSCVAPQDRLEEPRPRLAPSTGETDSGIAKPWRVLSEPDAQPQQFDAKTPEPVFNLVQFGAQSSPDPLLAVLADYRFEDLNFAFEKPSKEWTKVDPAKLNNAASLALVRGNPEIYFIVIAEKAGPAMDTALLKDLVTKRLRGKALEFEIALEKEERAGGLKGASLGAKALVQGQHIYYRYWVVGHNGYGYQLFAYCPAESAWRVELHFQRLLRCFHLIDMDRKFSGSVGEPIGVFESQAFRYRINPLPGWSVWPEAADSVPAAEYAATLDAQNTCVFVIPLPLQGRPADPDDLEAVFLPELGFQPGGTEVQKAEGVGKDQGRPGKAPIEYTASITEEGIEFQYLWRVLQKNECAYLVGGWTVLGGSRGGKSLRNAIDQFTPLEGEVHADRVKPELRVRTAHLLNEVGIREYRSEKFGQAAERFRLAAHYQPANPTYAVNMVDALTEFDGYEAALDAIGGLLERHPSAQAHEVLRAQLLYKLERYGEAVQSYATAASIETLSEDDIFSFASAAVTAERYDEVLETLDEMLTQRKSVTLRRWRASVLSQSGRHQVAITELARLTEERPDDLDCAETLADAYVAAKRYDEALEVCNDLIKRGHDSPQVLTLLGEVQLVASDFLAAKRSFERVLEAVPNDAYAREMLATAAARLGRGDNRRIREPIEPVALPAAVAALAESAEAEPLPETETGVVELLRIKGFYFRRGEPIRETMRRKYRVTSRQGVQSMKSMSFSFDPLRESLYINELVVRDASGELLATGELDDFYVLDDTYSGYDTYDQTATAPVPMVRVGCTIEVTSTRKYSGGGEHFGFEPSTLTGVSPVRTAVLFVSGDTERLEYRTNGPKVENREGLVYWAVSDPAELRFEDMQRPFSYYLPTVWINDAGQTWEAVGREYLEELAPLLRPDGATQKLSQQLTAGLSSDKERIAALAGYVQEELTYNAIEFGVRAHIPNKVSTVQRNRFGDCKDHSLLLYHLLQAAGLPSRLALVNTASPVLPGLPSLDQFDHMVVCVDAEPEDGGPVVIDATDKHLDPLAPVPYGLSGKRLFVLRPHTPALVRLPHYPSDAFVLECRREVAVAPFQDGAAAATVDEELKFSSYAARAIRSALESTSRRERNEILLSLLGEDKAIDLLSTKIEGLEELSEPLVLRLRYADASAFRRVAGAGGRLVGKLPSHWGSVYLSANRVPERTTPFECEEPILLRMKTRLRLPEGYRVVPPNKLREESRDRALSWKSLFAERPDGAEVTQGFRRPRGHYPASAYGLYSTAARRAVRQIAMPLTIAGDKLEGR